MDDATHDRIVFGNDRCSTRDPGYESLARLAVLVAIYLLTAATCLSAYETWIARVEPV
jgi:hypothetical protein